MRRQTTVSGAWKGAGSGLSVSLEITQRGDTLSGDGSYSVISGTTPGCGGESIPSSGVVHLAGQLRGGEVQARMTFADTWSPPYLGTATRDTVTGHFMSVDRGACALTLVRSR